MNDFGVHHRTADRTQIIELAGELDFATVSQFRDALQQVSLEPGQQLVVDLAELTFCDSNGLTALIVAHNRAAAVDGRLVLTAVPHRIARTLHIAGLEAVFCQHNSPAAAIADWKPPGG